MKLKDETPMEKLEKKVKDYLESPEKIRRSRDWVRLHIPGCLHGSICYMYTREQKSIFYDLILMAESYGPIPGLISDNNLKPHPHRFLAHELHTTVELLEEVLGIGSEGADPQFYENSHGIFIVNFDKWQFTEYDRQKPYRQAKKGYMDKSDPDRFKKGLNAKMTLNSKEDIEEFYAERGKKLEAGGIPE